MLKISECGQVIAKGYEAIEKDNIIYYSDIGI